MRGLYVNTKEKVEGLHSDPGLEMVRMGEIVAYLQESIVFDTFVKRSQVLDDVGGNCIDVRCFMEIMSHTAAAKMNSYDVFDREFTGSMSSILSSENVWAQACQERLADILIDIRVYLLAALKVKDYLLASKVVGLFGRWSCYFDAFLGEKIDILICESVQAEKKLKECLCLLEKKLSEKDTKKIESCGFSRKASARYRKKKRVY